MPDYAGVDSAARALADGVRRRLAALSAVVTVEGLGAAFTAAAIVHFAFVVPTELAVLLVGSAVAMALATYGPVFAVLAVAWLVE